MFRCMVLARMKEAFENKVHEAELGYTLGSRAALTALAENYVGLPF